jgi:hypothetical protein
MVILYVAAIAFMGSIMFDAFSSSSRNRRLYR